LRGRQPECEALAMLLEAARSGKSASLVLRGEAGIGKTALIEQLVGEADGCRVLRTAGAESEHELAFAALQQLCGPVIAGRDSLPVPQQNALGVAFGISAGPPPDRFLVGLAVLGLLSEAAEAQPLLCAVDDAQWLDRASAEVLAFVARRVQSEGIVLVFAMRELERHFEGIPEILLTGLAPEDAQALLESAWPSPLDSVVQEQFVAETRGNPLALLELPRDPVTLGLNGGLTARVPESVSSRIEESFQHRLEELPAGARLLMLIAAAEPLGDPFLLWDAAELCQLHADAGAAAEASGLIALGTRVVFRHPLVRSAAYGLASPDERRRVHAALAEATDPGNDPDRRAWHRAQATLGPSEEVAEELERSAGRAQARGGLAAAAAFKARAATLTRNPVQRGERALEAAEAALAAGSPGQVPELLRTAESAVLDALGLARTELIRAKLAFVINRGGAPTALLAAAKGVEPLDGALARNSYLDALVATMLAGRLVSAESGGAREVARAALAASPASEPAKPTDLLLEGLAVILAEGYTAGAALLDRAVHAACSQGLEGEELHFLFMIAATTIWDYDSYKVLTERQLRFARRTGALNLLPLVLTFRMGTWIIGGEFAAAAAVADEITAVCEATGVPPPRTGAVTLAAFRGREEDALEVIRSSVEDLVARGEGFSLTVVEWATAALYNGLGRYEEAMASAESACAHMDEIPAPSLWIHEYVEAAVRSGNLERALPVVKQITEMTQACATDWALGIGARCRALISDGEETEALYRDSIDRLERAGTRRELARSRLLYAEWLRRVGRRADARGELRVAHEMFESMGLEAFAARAARELAAAGARVHKQARESGRSLTAQESQVARLAGDGHSNRMIGEQLFISPRTVEYHLHKVFTKLDINTRAQLHAALVDSDRNGASRAIQAG
jgi:DNA-binding CsgD family transcriptional regulator